MELKNIVSANRSYRRFHQNHAIEEKSLQQLVELARLCPSSRNIQAIKFILSSSKETNEIIFPHLAWAGYLKDWKGPEEGERPSAYIILVGDKNIDTNFDTDIGITAQTMLLGAAELGLGGCMIGSIERTKLREKLQIAEHLQIKLVVALGKPKETVKITAVENNDIKYFRDDNGVHYVPKRSINELIYKSY